MSKKPSREHIAFRQINKLFDDHKEVSPASESATQLAAAYHRIHRLIDPTGEMTTEQVVGEVERVWTKLPQTADHITVTGGMKVYPLHPMDDAACIEPPDHGVIKFALYDPNLMDWLELQEDKVYSTPAAAAAAREG